MLLCLCSWPFPPSVTSSWTVRSSCWCLRERDSSCWACKVCMAASSWWCCIDSCCSDCHNRQNHIQSMHQVQVHTVITTATDTEQTILYLPTLDVPSTFLPCLRLCYNHVPPLRVGTEFLPPPAWTQERNPEVSPRWNTFPCQHPTLSPTQEDVNLRLHRLFVPISVWSLSVWLVPSPKPKGNASALCTTENISWEHCKVSTAE